METQMEMLAGGRVRAAFAPALSVVAAYWSATTRHNMAPIKASQPSRERESR